ncbi:PCMD domain-containing protein [Barnesiella sp. An55]|uniref:PCMD domain-containing protein n=1 Tax=Barnesiella sp. An55 TaxID=1965646 RepID=UPI000B36B0C8|nr:PCMD domain-containing protein [Barnesiella sp. An55]OUN72986.1 hypothetical protein B5G10_05820 [Barnesiella sp. An55]HIZ26260.1 PCMD domain-containing protein [Candidatus Barnesiella merdipullorum]
MKTMRKHIISLFPLLAMLLLAGCIQNDIPYPRIKAQILAIAAKGQVGSATIDNENRTVRIELADTIDLRHVRIESLTVTEGATTTLPADSTIDLSSNYTLTLSIYQDYTWTIQATQNIARSFSVEGQIGSPVFDAYNHRAIAYVNKDADLSNIHITELVLGPAGITTYSPQIENITDFSLGFQKVVVVYHDIMEEWTLYIVPSESEVSTDGVDAWTNVAWLHGSGKEGAQNGFEIKEATADTWEKVPDEYITHDKGSFTARMIHLKANTTYVCRAVSGDLVGNEVTFTTGALAELPNGSFDYWNLAGKVWNPWPEGSENFWDTGNKGATTLGDSNTQPTDDTWSGTGQAAKLATKFVGIGSLGKLAAGNMYVGNYIRTDGSNGVLNFGKPFTQRPTRLKGYFKYTTAPINKTNSDFTSLMGQPDTCQIYIALGDWSEPVEIRTKPSDRKVFDKNDPHVIAYAEMSSGESVLEYTPFTLELEYRDTARIPSYIIVVASASKYGDYFTGGDGSVLFIDDFSLEYDY